MTMTREEAMNMSNEQAVQILIPMRNMMCDQYGCPISDAVFALDKAIEALQAPTDSDLIRREDAINQAQDGVVVKTQDTSIHLCKTRVVTVDRINELPSADRPTGEWILVCDGAGECDNLYRCSHCGQEVGCEEYDKPKFCGECGADMRGDEE